MNIHALIVSKEEIKKRKGFTGADWWFDEHGDLQVRIEHLASPCREQSLLLHEISEAQACYLLGISVKQVDDFDRAYENLHPENHGLDAGDAQGCPYAGPHTVATACERMLFYLAGGPTHDSWKSYDIEVGQK